MLAEDAPAPKSPVWSNIALFKGLGRAELEAIGARLSRRTFCAGDTLIRQGVWSGELYIVGRGVVEISVEDDSGKGADEVTLRRLVTGDCFGEMSLITGSPPSATVTALTDGEAWTLAQHDFLRLALGQPELSRNISAILSERLLRTSRHQVTAERERVIVVAGMDPPLVRDLADAVAHLASRPVLFVDATSDTEDLSGRPVHTFQEFLAGELRAGGVPPIEGARVTAGAITVVRIGRDDWEGAADLTSALSRFDGAYAFILVAAPFGHPALSATLLAFATRILAVSAAANLPRLRRDLAALATTQRGFAAVRVVITDAPPGLQATLATIDTLSADLGAPVRAIVPPRASGSTLGVVGPLARWLVGQRIGLALGAGGAKGFAHLGALRALERAGVPIDCVTGVSAGALVAAAVGMRKSTEWLAAAFRRGSTKVFRPTLPRYSILSNRALGAWLKSDEMSAGSLIEHMPIPFAASAADLTEGREIVIRSGSLWRALLASTAIPGIYPPINIGSHWLVDGGVVNPVPVSIALLLGADVVVAVDLSEPLAPRKTLDNVHAAKLGKSPSLPQNILRSRDIMMSEIRAHTLGEPSVLVKPKVHGIALSSFAEGSQFVEAGESATEAVLPELRERLPWLA